MRRALLIGVDHYDAFGDLNGCINDVKALEPLLSKHDDGAPNFDCQVRTSDARQTTRDQFLGDLDLLFSGGADVALLYFAGHGAANTADVTLATSDGTAQTPGISLAEILTKVHASQVPEILIVIDCCFSGAAGGVPQLGMFDAVLRSGVSILAASRADQTAAETAAGRGVFSAFLCGAIEGGAADVLGKVTVGGIYAYLDESFGPWDQRPVFKANVERLHILRNCRPAVTLERLRLITEYFPTHDYEYQLDPSYEPDERYPPKNEEHERIFETLQRYRAAKLLVPVGEDHLFYAAVRSKSCRLTPLGQHYWHLGQAGRL